MIVPQNKNCNFFMVANEVFDFKLKPREFIVYCCLLRHSDKNGICFPSRRLIAEECCIDKKTTCIWDHMWKIQNIFQTGSIRRQTRQLKILKKRVL